MLQVARRVGTRLTYLNMLLNPAMTASCQVHHRDHLQDEPDPPSGAFGIRSTTPVCTRCCLPLSLSHSRENDYRKWDMMCRTNVHITFRTCNTKCITTGSHLVSMRMASSASVGFSKMSPSISTTCRTGKATLSTTVALSSCDDRHECPWYAGQLRIPDCCSRGVIRA